MRRGLIVAAVLWAGCGREKASPPQDGAAGSKPAPRPSLLAYVSNEVSQDLSVIATDRDSVIATIPLGARVRGVHVSPDGRFVYAALSGSPRCPPTMSDADCAKLPVNKQKDGVAQIDVTTRAIVRTIPGGSDPEQFALSPDGSRLYVSNEDAATASVLEPNTGKLVAAVPVGTEPEGVGVSPDGKLVFVTGETSNNITALDAADGKVLFHIAVDKRPRDMGFLPDGSRLYVSAEVGGTVSVVDVAKRRRIAVIPFPAGSRPMGVRVAPDGKRVYVCTGRHGTVEVIDPATNTIVGSVKVGARPWGIAITPDGKKLYTANGPSNDVSVVDTDSLKVIATIPAGQSPWGVAVAPPPAPILPR
jgi:PQQ-dependent catabolism-associated beta-propeller protein